jgi:predicted aspartyl protease
MSVRIYSPRLNETLFAQQEVRMGEVNVQLQLENTVDREMLRRGLLAEEQVRKTTLPAVVDSGAVMLMLPQDQVEALGLRELRKAVVRYADERTEERSIAGPVTVRFGNREANVDCVVGPPACEALLGQVPLEIMDLLIDCAQQKLLPRPESPILPLHKIK